MTSYTYHYDHAYHNGLEYTVNRILEHVWTYDRISLIFEVKQVEKRFISTPGTTYTLPEFLPLSVYTHRNNSLDEGP